MEAASLAWNPLGWEALAFAEIEPAARDLLAQRFPDVPLHGDFTLLRNEQFIVDADVLIGGTPCQGFSVAGLRGSLSDDRSNLCLEFIRLADAIDDLRRAHGRAPCYITWENVPGVLSTPDNAFGAFLGGLVGSDTAIVPPGRWPDAGVVSGPRRCAAWRCLDAQHFGVAQRRKRVFVLAVEHPRGWAAPEALLPIIESVRWNPPPRREAGQRPAHTIAARTRGGGGLGTDFDCDVGLVAHTLLGKPNSSHAADQDTYIAHALRAEGFDAGEDGTGRGTPLVPIAFSAKDSGADAANDVSPTLRSLNHAESHANSGWHMAVAFDMQQITSKVNRSVPQPVSPTLHRNGGAHAATDWAVRRLTPLECERLQGAPDNHTAITRKGKPIADGPRYKMIGNSMAVPVMRWTGERIQNVAKEIKSAQ
jgi:DNA (cytosine-5)-methyltransferase 1